MPAGVVLGFAVVGVPLDAGVVDAVAVEAIVLAVVAGDEGMAVVGCDEVEEVGEEGWVDGLDEFVVAGFEVGDEGSVDFDDGEGEVEAAEDVADGGDAAGGGDGEGQALAEQVLEGLAGVGGEGCFGGEEGAVEVGDVEGEGHGGEQRLPLLTLAVG